MSTPNANNLYLGSGEVWINLYVNNALSVWRHLGNVSKFELTSNVDTIEKQSAMSGARGTLKRVVTKTTMDIALTLDEFDPENVALALMGSTSAYTQGSGTATDTSLGSANVKKGYALDTGKKKITVTGVKKSPSTALVENTDYTYDAETGLINILTGATAITDGDTALWSGSYAAIASTQIQALANAKIEASLQFRSASDATGPRYIATVWKASLTPEGALSLLTENFGEITLKGMVLEDTTKSVGQRYFQQIVLP